MKVKLGAKQLAREMIKLGTSKEDAIMAIKESRSFFGRIFRDYDALCARVRNSYQERHIVSDEIQRIADSKHYITSPPVFSLRIFN